MTEILLAALDLPLKVIAWEDNQQKSLVAHNDASYIKQRYALSPEVLMSKHQIVIELE